MSNGSASLPLSEVGVVEQPPCRPPLEIIQDGSVWLLQEFQIEQDNPAAFDTFSARIDAMRAAQDKMEDDCHPCLLRWDDHNSVGALYWNELFEELHLTYSDLLDAWVLVPGADHFVFQSGDSLEQMQTAARAIQRLYDFKQLIFSDRTGTEQDSRDHRFIRHNIAASGVRFDRDRPIGTVSPPPMDDADEDDDQQERSVTPASTLMAAIPDLTDLEELDDTGPVLEYRATWESGELARISLLDTELTGNRDVVKEFTDVINDWERLGDLENVASVFEVGPSPAAWIAYHAGDGSLDSCLDELSRRQRLQLLTDVATAVETAHAHGIQRTELTPERIRLHSGEDDLRATLAGWGLERAVATAAGESLVTPYTAPEQLTGTIAQTTAIYQLGAVAYHLICDTQPFSDATTLPTAIRSADLTPPSSATDVSTSVDTVLRRAMKPTPEERYSSPSTFTDRLLSALGYS